jgi:hypothetical protein
MDHRLHRTAPLGASAPAGKVCVITGTGGSMGRATALTFAREGASVVNLAARSHFSPLESSYVTGIDLVVDGGLKVW